MRLPAFIPALVLSFSLAQAALAAAPGIYEKSAPIAAEVAYQRLYDALEAGGYYVIFEPDMGRSLAGMRERLGDDYNRNGLDVMRSLVFCNPKKTNQMSNLDPALLALCPLHLTLTAKAGVSTVHFGRISTLAAGSPGAAAIDAVEADIVRIIEDALHAE